MFGDLILVLALTVPTVLLFRRLKLPSIAGILAVGAAVGPHGFGWIGHAEEVDHLAEVGVMLLLFTIGLEFSLPKLFLQGRRLLLAGSSQMVLTFSVTLLAALAFERSMTEAVLLGMLVAPSSTAFVLKILNDTRQIDAPHGSFTVGVLLFQDLCVIPLMLVLPLLAGQSDGVGGVVLAFGKAILALLAIVVIARYGFPRAAKIVVRLGGRELFTLFVVLTALTAAWATEAIGLSLALGAFVAGLFISESEYSHQVVSEILPFRDVFNALFFVSVGMLFEFSLLMERPILILTLVTLLVAVKALVIFPIALWLTRSPHVAILSAIGLAQVGEFSFVLLTQAQHFDLLAPQSEATFLAVAILSMLASPFLIDLAPRIARRVTPGMADAGKPDAKRVIRPKVLILGYGLNGENVARVLHQAGVPFQVIELNIQRVTEASKRGVPTLFGDGSRSDVLEHAGVEAAEILVVAIADPDATRRAIAVARTLHSDLHIIVRTRFMAERNGLVLLGANEVIPEEFETSIQIFSRVLRKLGVPRGNIAVQAEMIRSEGYQMMRGEVDPLRSLEVMKEVLADTLIEPLRVPSDSKAMGKSLRELDLRAATGAAVISAVANGQVIQAPGADFVITPGTLLVVTGNHEQIARCRDLLAGITRESGSAKK
jgi:CPA2 family monovalent cation:H+ antiporter-2